MRISDWSSYVCSSDLLPVTGSDCDARRVNAGLRAARLHRAAEHQRGIDAAECEVVAHNVLGLDVAPVAGHVIEFDAPRVRRLQVQRRCEPPAIHNPDLPPRVVTAAGHHRTAAMALPQ